MIRSFLKYGPSMNLEIPSKPFHNPVTNSCTTSGVHNPMADHHPANNNLRLHRMIASYREQLNAAFINTRFRISSLFQVGQSPAAIFPHNPVINSCTTSGVHNPMADHHPENNHLRLHRMIASFREQLNAAFINTRFRISSLFQADQSPTAHFPHAAFSFTILAILGLLQVKYQGKDKTPFDSHPKTIFLAITSLLIYGFGYGIQLRLSSTRYNRNYRIVSETVHFCMFWAGSLSLAATASFLFPDSVRPFLFVFYFITSAGALLYWVYRRFNRDHRELGNEWWRRSQQFFMTTWQHLAHCFTEQRQILPL